MRSLFQREWRLTRGPLLGALAAQLTFLFLHTPRTYSAVRESDPSIVGLLLAAWLGYHRFYAEQRRGTWLLQPFSRTQLVLAKVIPASAALLVFALVESLSRYAWVATSNSPSGPILSLVPYVREALNVALGSTLALFFAAAIASFSERRWVQMVGIAAGIAWLFVSTAPDHQLHALTGHGGVMEIPSRAWHLLGLTVIACLGAATLVMTARDLGRAASSMTRILRALWVTPLALFAMLIAVHFVPEERHPSAFDGVELLRDGEIVIAHHDATGVTATRRDGRVVQFPRFRDRGHSERVSLHRRARAYAFGQPIWFSPRNAFVAEDGRSLSFFEQRGEQDVGTACWGAQGMRQGTVHCAPGPQIIGIEQVASGDGLLVVTHESVHVLDARGDHVRLQAPNIQGAAWIGDEEDRERALAIFTGDALIITGPVERRCPAASANASIGVLDDNTVVILDHEVLTYCREATTTTATWPQLPEGSRYLDLGMSLVLPLAMNPYASTSTWWLAAFLRLIGAAIVLGIARKRGLIHVLIGLVLGPGYLLAAIVSETDVDIVAIVRERILRTAGSR
jgi:hypothetical protein